MRRAEVFKCIRTSMFSNVNSILIISILIFRSSALVERYQLLSSILHAITTPHTPAHQQRNSQRNPCDMLHFLFLLCSQFSFAARFSRLISKRKRLASRFPCLMSRFKRHVSRLTCLVVSVQRLSSRFPRLMSRRKRHVSRLTCPIYNVQRLVSRLICLMSHCKRRVSRMICL